MAWINPNKISNRWIDILSLQIVNYLEGTDVIIVSACWQLSLTAFAMSNSAVPAHHCAANFAKPTRLNRQTPAQDNPWPYILQREQHFSRTANPSPSPINVALCLYYYRKSSA